VNDLPQIPTNAATEAEAQAATPPVEPTAAKAPHPWRWAWRLATLALFFYLLGYFSNPVTTPLMCKIYG
jgi:hypothetical protein